MTRVCDKSHDPSFVTFLLSMTWVECPDDTPNLLYHTQFSGTVGLSKYLYISNFYKSIEDEDQYCLDSGETYSLINFSTYRPLRVVFLEEKYSDLVHEL